MDDKDKAREIVRDCIKDGVNAKMIGGVLAQQGYGYDTVKEVMAEFGIRYRSAEEKEKKFERRFDAFSRFLGNYSLLILTIVGVIYLVALYYIDLIMFDNAVTFFAQSFPKAILCAIIIKVLVAPFSGRNYVIRKNTWSKAIIMGFLVVLTRVNLAGLITLNLITIVASVCILFLFWRLYDFPYEASIALWVILVIFTFIYDVVLYMAFNNSITFKEVIDQAIGK